MTAPDAKLASNLVINSDRLWESLDAMAQIGPGVRGGSNRQTLTDADAEGRALFQSWCEAAGLTLGVDRMGTMFMRREGTDPEALPVYMGSHLDTQPTGGRYDGVLGVLGGLEVMRTLNDLGIRTRRPIILVNFTNEEGARFAPPMMASGVFAGVHSLDWAYDRTDAEGHRFGAELERIGWVGPEEVGARNMHAFFELHIEQGPVLEAEGKQIGVVTHGQGLLWLQITLTGRESHTGSTPMPMRVNAGLGMARVTEAVHRIAMSHPPDAKGAVGHVEVYPNSPNIIPGRCVFTVDFRSASHDILADMEARLRAEAEAIAADLGLEIAFEQTGHFEPVAFDAGCLAAIRRAVARHGYSSMDLISGAGHDACWINRVAPTAMIMTPCKDGLSHNEDESITQEEAAAGTNVLLDAVVETAEIAP